MADAEAPKHPLDGLYQFVRGHLLIANNVVLASGTLVAALDFLAPRLSVLPRIVYSATALLVLLMLVVGAAPSLASRGRAREVQIPLWRRPGWQFALAILLGVSILGWASVAKAGDRGWLASNIPAARSLQDSLLSMASDVSDIKGGVASANGKLDTVMEAINPANPASRCPDLLCAAINGSSPAAIAKLLDQGATLPADETAKATIAKGIGLSTQRGRVEALDLLMAHGLNPNQRMLPTMSGEAAMTDAARAFARSGMAVSRLGDRPGVRGQHVFGSADVNAWNQVAVCLFANSGGVSLIELAAMRGDSELYAHLVAKGVAPPDRPLQCRWGSARNGGGARVAIDSGAASVQALR